MFGGRSRSRSIYEESILSYTCLLRVCEQNILYVLLPYLERVFIAPEIMRVNFRLRHSNLKFFYFSACDIY